MIGNLSKEALEHFVVIEKVIIPVEKVIDIYSVIFFTPWTGIPLLQNQLNESKNAERPPNCGKLKLLALQYIVSEIIVPRSVDSDSGER